MDHPLAKLFVQVASPSIMVNFNFLQNALQQTGPWKGKDILINAPWLISSLKDKIRSIVWADAVKDVEKFIQPIEQASLELWRTELFLNCVEQLEKYIYNKT